MLDRRTTARHVVTNLEAKIGGKTSRPIDISDIGIRLVTSEPLVLGAILPVKLHSSNHPINIEARIVWRSPTIVTGHPKWEHGLIFFQPLKEINSLLADLTSNLSQARSRRSILERRQRLHDADSNRRSHDRRGIKKLYEDLSTLGKSFDIWTRLYTYRRPISAMNSTHAWINGQKKIFLGSNSFFGLSSHPDVKEAAIKATERFGTGTGGSQVLNGTTELHEELCDAMAKFKGTEAAIVFTSGFLANQATISSLFKSKEDVIFADERDHASLIDGCRNSNARVRFFKHNDMENLEKKLSQYKLQANKLIVVDGIFSMDGDICPLDKIVNLAKQYNALIMLDDAHATGILGKTGRGTAEHFSVSSSIDMTTVTLSKAIGCSGGIICGSKALIKFLVHQCRGHIFATSLPASTCAAAIAAIQVIEQNHTELMRNLLVNSEHLASGLRKLGFQVLESDSKVIIPLILPDEQIAYKFSSELEKHGVYVNAVSRPAVPRELSRLRLSCTSSHTAFDIDLALSAFNAAGRKIGII